jgi:hypothetical protein
MREKMRLSPSLKTVSGVALWGICSLPRRAEQRHGQFFADMSAAPDVSLKWEFCQLSAFATATLRALKSEKI